MSVQNRHFQKQLKRNGVNVLIDGVECLAFFREIEDTASTYVNDRKYLFTDAEIKQGSIIQALDQTWIVNHMAVQYKDYSKATIERIDSIKMVLDGKLHIIPTLIESVQLRNKENNLLDTVAGTLKLTMQDNAISSLINSGMRFIKMDTAWKILTTSSEHKGLKYIYVERTLFTSDDDKENEIADKHLITDAPDAPEEPTEPTEPDPEEPSENYVLTINGYDDALAGFTEDYTVTITNNGEPVLEKVVTWDIINADFTTTPPYATIESVDGYNCTIKGGSTKYIGKSVILICKCEELGLETEKTIQIVGF